MNGIWWTNSEAQRGCSSVVQFVLCRCEGGREGGKGTEALKLSGSQGCGDQHRRWQLGFWLGFETWIVLSFKRAQFLVFLGHVSYFPLNILVIRRAFIVSRTQISFLFSSGWYFQPLPPAWPWASSAEHPLCLAVGNILVCCDSRRFWKWKCWSPVPLIPTIISLSSRFVPFGRGRQ